MDFAIGGVEALSGAAAPTLRFAAEVDAHGRAVRALALNARLRIHAERRRHGDAEVERLRELFGAPADWARAIGPVPWADVAVHVPAFDGTTTVDLRVPCTYDFDVAAAKYLAALDGGDVPVELLFSGTVTWAAAGGRLQSAMVPWDRDASARMPVAVWRQAVAAAFGDCGWLRVDRELLGRLQAFRSRRGLISWDQTLEALLAEARR